MPDAPKIFFGKWFRWILMALAVAAIYAGYIIATSQPPVTLDYSQVIGLVESGKVERVVFRGDQITGQLKVEIDGPRGARKRPRTLAVVVSGRLWESASRCPVVWCPAVGGSVVAFAFAAGSALAVAAGSGSVASPPGAGCPDPG